MDAPTCVQVTMADGSASEAPVTIPALSARHRSRCIRPSIPAQRFGQMSRDVGIAPVGPLRSRRLYGQEGGYRHYAESPNWLEFRSGLLASQSRAASMPFVSFGHLPPTGRSVRTYGINLGGEPRSELRASPASVGCGGAGLHGRTVGNEHVARSGAGPRSRVPRIGLASRHGPRTAPRTGPALGPAMVDSVERGMALTRTYRLRPEWRVRSMDPTSAFHRAPALARPSELARGLVAR